MYILVLTDSEYGIFNVKNPRHGKCAKFNVVGICENRNHPYKWFNKW
jgi:hypothetical protein